MSNSKSPIASETVAAPVQPQQCSMSASTAEANHHHETLAIIPARGGSKGIPQKNMQDIGGKPLIWYSIQVALAAGNIDRVIVSTDSEEIAEAAKKAGAEVPFLRPSKIAGDTSEIMHAILYTKDRLYKEERYSPGYQICMYPTHPFRKVSTVSQLVATLKRGHTRVTTYKEIEAPIGGFLFGDETTSQLTDQNAMPGGVYRRSYGHFLGRALRLTPHKEYIHLLTDPIELIDIDNWEDLFLAREIINNNMYDFEL